VIGAVQAAPLEVAAFPLLSAAVVPELVSDLSKMAPHFFPFPWRVVWQLTLDRRHFVLKARAMLKVRLGRVPAR
jgi:hypothetical protein